MVIKLEVPEEYLADHEPEEFGRLLKLNAALLMFRSKEISAGAAAELAGVDRFTFALECQKRNIPVVDYPPEDLRSEIESFRNAS